MGQYYVDNPLLYTRLIMLEKCSIGDNPYTVRGV